MVAYDWKVRTSPRRVDRPSPLILLWAYLLSWAYEPWTAVMGGPLFKAREDDERPKENRQDQPNPNYASTVSMNWLREKQLEVCGHKRKAARSMWTQVEVCRKRIQNDLQRLVTERHQRRFFSGWEMKQ
ncbi:hypothetical protein Tco_0574236 [Tanacetum coccineum]